MAAFAYSTRRNLPQLRRAMGFVLLLWLQCGSSSMRNMVSLPSNICDLNRNEKPVNCIFGSYNITSYPSFCPSRSVCHLGPSEFCRENSPETLCHSKLVCRCGRCQGCINDECYMKLCQQRNVWEKRMTNAAPDAYSVFGAEDEKFYKK